MPLNNPLAAAILQAIEQAKQEQAIKAQVMQSFGFSPVWNEFGYVPQGQAVMIDDNKAYTREGGLDPTSQSALKNILGIQRERPTQAEPIGFQRSPLFGDPAQQQLWKYFGFHAIAPEDAQQLLNMFLNRGTNGNNR